MTPEQVRAALNDARDKIDELHALLGPVLNAWSEAKTAAAAAIPQGTRKDVTAVSGLSQAAEEGFYALHDNSARLGFFLRDLANEY